MKRFFKIISILLFSTVTLFAQQEKNKFTSGFDAQEFDDLLRLNVSFLDTTKGNQFLDYQSGYKFLYNSPSMGLDNVWNLWIRDDSTVVILLRGTTSDPRSILSDFYCAMVPAKGQIILSANDTVKYELATDEKAAVHLGFLIGFAFLSKDIQPKLDSLYKMGYHNCLISGHSQGGALVYYVSAWMNSLKKNGVYPLLNVKSYASASPKIGNMYFAYDYDNTTRSEWTYSITNSADPVPELPFTTQQVDVDVNEPNPILNLMKSFDKLPFFKRIVVKHAFKSMMRKAAKSSKEYQKYLGGFSSGLIKKEFPELKLPPVVNTTYFVRPGVPISLVVNENYFNFFKINDGLYYHHGVTAYRYLLRQYYTGLNQITKEDINKLLNIK